jgi:DNA polymerase III delta subunit
MEVKDENTFFKGQKFAKNLILVEEKDRPYLITKIKEEEKGQILFFDETKTFSDLMGEVNQCSLFDEKKILLVFNVENYSEENWDQIFNDKQNVFYFFIRDAKKSIQERFTKDGGILSLLNEKIWDRKNRLTAEVVYTIHKNAVVISQSCAYRFVERTFFDLQLFHNELLKLCSYCYSKKKIEIEDIDALVPLPLEENSFKISEEMVWERKGADNFKVDSTSTLLQIIGAFRFQAYLGLKILSKENVNIPPWQEKKYKQKANNFGPLYFKNIILLLFKIEQRAKQTHLCPSALFDIACLEILALARK